MKIKQSFPTIKNMQSSNGNDVPNQFIINNVTMKIGTKNVVGNVFQSYKSVICFASADGATVILDEKFWKYSKTTGKYRNMFLGEDKKTTQEKINRGIYKIGNLNR